MNDREIAMRVVSYEEAGRRLDKSLGSETPAVVTSR